jgi:spore germination cell wall hydrolase CwlJ-like protein
MGRRFSRRMWWGLAAFAPLPVLGVGFLGLAHAGVEPASELYFRAELWLSGTGADYSNRAAKANAFKPLTADAAILFTTSAKGPRADQYQIVKTTTYAGKQTISASLAGSMPDITGSLPSTSRNVVSRDRKGDRLNPTVSDVALRGSLDSGFSAALFMAAPSNQEEVEAVFNAARPVPSPESIAYRPSQKALAFKSAGESQAEFEERERRCLATAIYFEARGEPVRGQIAVAQVILNRVRSPQFPQTICGVVYQGQMQKGCQFSFACDGHTDMPRDNEQWALAQDIAKQASSGQVWLPEVGYSTYYHANYVRPGWVNNMNKIDKIGNHIFYKKRHEQPYVVEASAQSTTGTATDAVPAATPAVSLVSSGGTATPATGLSFSPSE